MVYALNLDDARINPTANFKDVASIVNLIVPFLMAAAALGALVVALLAGFTIITAGADAEKIKKAQKMIKFSIIGFGVVIISFLILKIIGLIFPGLNLPL